MATDGRSDHRLTGKRRPRAGAPRVRAALAAVAAVVVAHWGLAAAGDDAALQPPTMGGPPGHPGFPPQTAVPSTTTLPFMLVHLPKCAGTSARNALFGILRSQGTSGPSMCIPGTPATPSYTILNVSDCGGRDAAGKVVPLDRAFVAVGGHFQYAWTAQVLANFSQVG